MLYERDGQCGIYSEHHSVHIIPVHFFFNLSIPRTNSIQWTTVEFLLGDYLYACDAD